MPLAALTVTVTVSLCAVVMLAEVGTAVTVGVDVLGVRYPVPVSANCCVAPLALSALSVRVSVPVSAPVAFGVKSTPIAQLDPTASGAEVEQVVASASIMKLVLDTGRPLMVSG